MNPIRQAFQLLAAFAVAWLIGATALSDSPVQWPSWADRVFLPSPASSSEPAAAPPRDSAYPAAPPHATNTVIRPPGPSADEIREWEPAARDGHSSSPVRLGQPIAPPPPFQTVDGLGGPSLFPQQPVPERAVAQEPWPDQRRLFVAPGPPTAGELTIGAATNSGESADSPPAEQVAGRPAPGTTAHSEPHHPPPRTGAGSRLTTYRSDDFSSGPSYDGVPFLPDANLSVYQGKYPNPTQRPWLELGRPFYGNGPLEPGLPLLGEHNLFFPQFVLYGDFRTAVAYNEQNGQSLAQWANRLNLDFDLKLTATERVHAFLGPIDRGNQFTRVEFDDGDVTFFDEFDGNFDTIFFEGDAGAIAGGMIGSDPPFDLPFTVGIIPLVLQNGVWLEDAFTGAAVTIPARNSPTFDWSNFDTTFFAGFDRVTTPAFAGDDDSAELFGWTSFIEAYGGYIEAGFVRVEDTAGLGRSYNNFAIAYTRRYGHFVSNSVRYIVNTNQTPNGAAQTADGSIVLIENSFITRCPQRVVPYFNLWAGFGNPQSVARAAGSGGILRNTGINFETDGLTGYPTLDASGTNTYGGAIGINLLGPDFSDQWIVEVATVQTMGSRPFRNAAGDQYAIGVRYQRPISNSVLIRVDGMYGILSGAENITGSRLELRHKF